MPYETLVPISGSRKAAPRGAKLSGSLNDHEQMTVTVILERKAPVTEVKSFDSRETFSEVHGADPGALAAVAKFAHEHGLTVVESSARKRRVMLGGSISKMRKAFNVELHCYKNETTGHTFRGRTGTISIAQELHSSVLAVLGLDNRPAAQPHFRLAQKKKKTTVPITFTPPQVAALYGFPTNVTGTGQTIGIIELGGGYQAADLTTYFKSIKVAEPNVVAIAVDGGANAPGGDADGEVLLDIEVAGSIAPGANIAVYFAPNTDQGFIDAITDAVHDASNKPSVISISWGGPEDSWTAQSQTAMNAALQDAASLGVTVTIASGDNGSTDGETDGALHVDFPASSPYALACGGTKLAGSGHTITSESVWNETANKEGAGGGGVSGVFALPAYQKSASVPVNPNTNFVGRGVPDVSGNADPATGYQILVDGQKQVVGGTSAVAPLWAALVALINQQLGKNLGFLNPTIYALGSGFYDITQGNNDDGNLGYYSAGPGWDACTGLGTPNAAALLSALSKAVGATSGK